MKRIRLTTAEALAKYLVAQKIEVDGKVEQLFGTLLWYFWSR